MPPWHLALPLGDAPSGLQRFISWVVDLSADEGYLVLLLVFTPVMFWLGRRQEARWNRILDALAAPLGLSRESKRSFAGTYQGWHLWLGMQPHAMGGEDDTTCLTVRVDLEAELPQDFVATPRKWAGFLSSFYARTFEAQEPRLDERFVFQCDFVTQGQKIVEEEAVQEALAHLGGGDALGYVHKNQVGLAFTKGEPDGATLHQHIGELIAVATALRAVLRLGSPPDWDRVEASP